MDSPVKPPKPGIHDLIKLSELLAHVDGIDDLHPDARLDVFQSLARLESLGNLTQDQIQQAQPAPPAETAAPVASPTTAKSSTKLPSTVPPKPSTKAAPPEKVETDPVRIALAALAKRMQITPPAPKKAATPPAGASGPGGSTVAAPPSAPAAPLSPQEALTQALLEFHSRRKPAASRAASTFSPARVPEVQAKPKAANSQPRVNSFSRKSWSATGKILKSSDVTDTGDDSAN